MEPRQFKAGHPGRLVRVGKGSAAYWAYVPARLPPRIEWTAEVVRLLSEADRALGRLAGVGQNLPNPHLLIGPFKRREAVLSSRIEGTQASLSDLLLFEAAPGTEGGAPDAREVSNYVRALDHGLVRQKTLPMSLRLMKEMHAILMEGVRGQERTPGEFRRSQNWIGPPGCTIGDAAFVPPPPDELMGVLGELEKFLHAPAGDLPPLVRMALIHYQFEAIHPFLDGNGRIGRLLVTMLLCTEDVLPGPLLYLSAYFEKNRGAYYGALLNVSREGAWGAWISLFLRGVAEQAADAVVRADRLLALRAEYQRRVRGVRASAAVLGLVDEMFKSPAITVGRAAGVLGMTLAAAQKNVDKLVLLGILREVTGRKRGRVYVAEGVSGVVE